MRVCMGAGGRTPLGSPSGVEQGTNSPRRGSASRSKCADCATRKLCIIGGLPQAAVSGMGPRMRERIFEQGEMLSREGDVGSHFRIIKVGRVFLCHGNPDGAERPVAIAERGSVFGLCSYMGQPNQISILAASSGRLCEIETERIESLARNDRTFRERLGKLFSDNVRLLSRWAGALGRRNVVSQVAISLQLMAEGQHSTLVTIPSHTALAELLGTTRESVARALGALETAGCLQRKSLRRCEIHSVPLRDWVARHTS